MFNVLVIPYVSTYRSQLRLTVTLPVHDAIAVKQGDAELAKGGLSYLALSMSDCVTEPLRHSYNHNNHTPQSTLISTYVSSIKPL